MVLLDLCYRTHETQFASFGCVRKMTLFYNYGVSVKNYTFFYLWFFRILNILSKDFCNNQVELEVNHNYTTYNAHPIKLNYKN